MHYYCIGTQDKRDIGGNCVCYVPFKEVEFVGGTRAAVTIPMPKC